MANLWLATRGHGDRSADSQDRPIPNGVRRCPRGKYEQITAKNVCLCPQKLGRFFDRFLWAFPPFYSAFACARVRVNLNANRLTATMFALLNHIVVIAV